MIKNCLTLFNLPVRFTTTFPALWSSITSNSPMYPTTNSNTDSSDAKKKLSKRCCTRVSHFSLAESFFITQS